MYRRVKDRISSTENLNQKKILSNINFNIKEGTMTLVIGSPGSGKSSLCNILSNQINGKVTGDVLFGGEEIRAEDHSHRVAYVHDKDNHLALLTVKETFEFADALLTPNTTKEDRTRKVDAIMQILGLTHRADTIVGDDLNRGVSGGERRRVTIGVELMKRCQLIVMDEATTGLDSSTSLQIFRALRIIADEMAPVFATLKQPGRELLNLFDNVIVMHEGHIVYAGEREEMINYFTQLNYPLNTLTNPADEVLSIVDRYGDELIDVWKKHETIEEIENADGRPQVSYKKFSHNSLYQFKWGIKRGFQLMKNNPGITISRIIFAMIMSAIVGTMFLQLGNSQSSLNGLQGALFMVSTFPAFQALASFPTIFAMRPVFYYQRKNHYYKAIPIQVADFIVGLPATIIESIVFATICYWLIGFNTLFVRFLYFMLMVIAIEILFSIIVKIAGFVFPSFLIANIVVPPIIFMSTFFSGFAVTYDRAPVYLRWIYWVSPFRYLLEGLSINQFYDTDFECDDDEFLPPNNYNKLDLPYELGGFEGNQICPITTGEQVLLSSEFETEYAYAWYWILVIVGYIFVAFILMIITSYWVYNDKPPRDLKQAHQRREQQNRKVTNLKDSIRTSRGLTLSKLSDLSDENSEGQDDESINNSNSECSSNERFDIIPFLNASTEGKRMDTHIPIYLEWQNLSYTVRVAPNKGAASVFGNFPILSKCLQQDLVLLDNVSGYVKPGMLIAFMGPSGAGKTTLLDVLSQRKTAGKIDGEIRINGAPLDPATLSRFSGYVEQNNIHIETETVEEALLMSASLRLCYPNGHPNEKSITRNDRIEHIIWVMKVLSLTQIRGAMISELSLEQKKRLTIGVELAANPSLLWLDEPTSGLDAMAALQVMKAVKSIADSGVSVVCTLHQPSELLFSWCTHLLLLSPGGHVAYFGNLSDAAYEVEEYFSQFNLHRKEQQNPADFFLDCCTSKQVNDENQTIIESYEQSEQYKQILNELESGKIIPRYEDTNKNNNFLSKLLCCFRRTNKTTVDSNIDNFPPPSYGNNYSRSIFVQWYYLVSRNVRSWWRSPISLLIMFSLAVAFGLLLGLLFSERDDSQSGAAESTAVYFFITLVLSTAVMSFIPQIFAERAVFYRETTAKAYRNVTYLFSLVVVTFILLFLCACIEIVMLWSIAGLQTDWYRVGYLFGVGILISFCSYGFALFISCISPVAELGNGLFSIVNLLNAFTNGFLLLRTEIPSYWIWAYWVGYQHYALEGLLINEFDGRTFECPNNEGALPVPVPSISDPLRVQYYCRSTSGEDVLDALEVHDGWLLIDILVLVGIISLLIALSALAIAKLKHIKR